MVRVTGHALFLDCSSSQSPSAAAAHGLGFLMVSWKSDSPTECKISRSTLGIHGLGVHCTSYVPEIHQDNTEIHWCTLCTGKAKLCKADVSVAETRHFGKVVRKTYLDQTVRYPSRNHSCLFLTSSSMKLPS